MKRARIPKALMAAVVVALFDKIVEKIEKPKERKGGTDSQDHGCF